MKKTLKCSTSYLVLLPSLSFKYEEVRAAYRLMFQVVSVDHPRMLRPPDTTWNQRHTYKLDENFITLA